MSRNRASLRTRSLIRLDLTAHGAAFVSCTIGGVFLESVVLMAAASHHLATIGIRLLTAEQRNERTPPPLDNIMFSIAQLALWTCCLSLAVYVASRGAHGMFHAKHLNAIAVLGFAVPGVLGGLTSGALIRWSVHPGRGIDKADTLLSAAPSALVLCVAGGTLLVDGGRLDAIVGLAIILMLGVRTLVCLARALD
jgi:hypothetical protein